MKKTQAKEITTPKSLITEAHVKAALEADKGTDAHLISWKIQDFTKKGDNYSSTVTSVQVRFSQHGTDSDVSYVVKLNPRLKSQSFEQLIHLIFEKEVNFYMSVMPELNRSLKTVGLEPLHMPQCYYGTSDEQKEIIFLEDLRLKGFKLCDLKKGMDKIHTTLVLQELARLHAASLLLQKQTSDKDIDEELKFLLKEWIDFDGNVKSVIIPLFAHHIANGVDILKKIGGYEKSVSWLEDLKPCLQEVFKKQLGNGAYDVVCHGDCWNNNILFRYDEEGNPIEVMLLDLQASRKASFATDLNYLLHTSLDGSVRKPNLEALLDHYYESFRSFMNSGGIDMPFSRAEIHQEFRDKNVFGILSALMVVPPHLLESDEVPDLSGITDEGFQDFLQDFKAQAMAMVDKNPLLKPRFLSTFDEMIERGIIA